MTHLGSSLVFWIKYAQQMERLFYDKKERSESLSDEACSQVEQVGRRALEEVVSFLETCVDPIEVAFSETAECKRRSQSHTVRNHWSIEFNLSPLNPNKSAQAAFITVGTSIECHAQGDIVAWMWKGGSRRGEEQLVETLGTKVKARSKDMNWPYGAVVLAARVLDDSERESLDASADAWLEEIRLAYSAITPSELERLFYGN